MLSVSSQLLSQYWMFVPSPEKQPESQWMAWLFICHLLIGISALCFVAVRLMSALENEEDQQQLFPWIAKKSFASLLNDLSEIPKWFKQGSPAPEQKNKVASTVHGFGLLLTLGLGLTGILFFIGIDSDGAMDVMTHFFRDSHELLAMLLWLYFFGHLLMFIIHLMQGHKQILDIFFTGKRKK